MNTFSPGDRVYLCCPDNATLDGQLAIVEALTEWGAHVVSVAPTWPGSTSSRYRALFSELVPAREAVPVAAHRDGCTGSLCPTCGGANMVRSGSCECCLDCGSTSGCS